MQKAKTILAVLTAACGLSLLGTGCQSMDKNGEEHPATEHPENGEHPSNGEHPAGEHPAGEHPAGEHPGG